MNISKIAAENASQESLECTEKTHSKTDSVFGEDLIVSGDIHHGMEQHPAQKSPPKTTFPLPDVGTPLTGGYSNVAEGGFCLHCIKLAMTSNTIRLTQSVKYQQDTSEKPCKNELQLWGHTTG